VSEPTEAPRTHADVLLVEDTIDEALLLKTAIEDAGDYTVTLAQDGDHGVERLEGRPWDLAVIDLNLPGRDGMDVIRLAKELYPDMPVIAVTAHTSDVYVDTAYRAGADLVLQKPVDKADLLEHLRQLCPLAEAGSAAETRILALGTRPGDVFAGCGGVLLQHRDRGHDVVVFTLAGGDPDGGSRLRTAAHTAADRLGARLVFGSATEPEMINLQDAAQMVRTLVSELRPAAFYIPTDSDRTPNRVATHRVGAAMVGEVARVLAYQTPTATLDFRPNLFLDVQAVIDRKAELLQPFDGLGLENVSPPDARAAARYWGRFADPLEAEPFEVVGGEP